MDSEELKDENPVDPIDLSIFKEHLESNLLNIIGSLSKSEKVIILENSLISKLNFFTIMEKLKKLNVKQKLIILKRGTLMADSPIFVYLIPPKKECVEIIDKYIEEIIKILLQVQKIK